MREDIFCYVANAERKNVASQNHRGLYLNLNQNFTPGSKRIDFHFVKWSRSVFLIQISQTTEVNFKRYFILLMMNSESMNFCTHQYMQMAVRLCYFIVFCNVAVYIANADRQKHCIYVTQSAIFDHVTASSPGTLNQLSTDFVCYHGYI